MNWKAKKRRPCNWYETPHKVFAWYPVRIYTSGGVEKDEMVWWTHVLRTGKYLYDSQGGSITWTYDFIEIETQ